MRCLQLLDFGRGGRLLGPRLQEEIHIHLDRQLFQETISTLAKPKANEGPPGSYSLLFCRSFRTHIVSVLYASAGTRANAKLG
jgi:hypothetical protein